LRSSADNPTPAWRLAKGTRGSQGAAFPFDIGAGRPDLASRKGAVMNIVKWNPFRELEDMQTRLNRFLNEDFPRRAERDGVFFADWAPPVDIEETDKEFMIKAELPDIHKEEVKVEVLDGVLTIEGERKREKEDKGKRFHKVERSYGKFVRQFALPTAVAADQVKAEFKDGMLNVHLPKTVEARPKAIEVQVTS
jgi:HSP20 family protein